MQTTSTNGSTSKPARAKAPAKGRARKSAATIKDSPKDTLHLKIKSPPSGDQLAHMIATAAYYQAERRGFAPGNELEDWLIAEREVKSMYS